MRGSRKSRRKRLIVFVGAPLHGLHSKIFEAYWTKRDQRMAKDSKRSFWKEIKQDSARSRKKSREIKRKHLTKGAAFRPEGEGRNALLGWPDCFAVYSESFNSKLSNWNSSKVKSTRSYATACIVPSRCSLTRKSKCSPTVSPSHIPWTGESHSSRLIHLFVKRRALLKNRIQN